MQLRRPLTPEVINFEGDLPFSEDEEDYSEVSTEAVLGEPHSDIEEEDSTWEEDDSNLSSTSDSNEDSEDCSDSDSNWDSQEESEQEEEQLNRPQPDDRPHCPLCGLWLVRHIGTTEEAYQEVHRDWTPEERLRGSNSLLIIEILDR